MAGEVDKMIPWICHPLFVIALITGFYDFLAP